jgi:hypothetical protein
VGVAGAAAQRRVLLIGGEGVQLLADGGVLGTLFVEDLPDSAEPRPAGQDPLLFYSRGPAFGLQAAQESQCLQGRRDAGLVAGRGEVVLGGGPEPAGLSAG